MSGRAYLEYKNCESCELAGRPMVLGSGKSHSPDIMFIAEAPGATEVAIEEPLVGKSGQFLRKVIRDVGIDEDNCWFTNMCMCNPVRNKTPKAAMVRACRERLYREIVTVKPKLVVTLGKIAASYLVGLKQKIQHTHRVYRELNLNKKGTGKHSVGVIPCYHPSGVLRTPDLFRDFLSDLEYVKTVLDGEPPVIDPPYENYKYVTTQKKFEKFCSKLSTKSLVATDLETDSTSWFDARILCAGFTWKKNHAWVVDWRLIERNPDNLRLLNDSLKNVNLALQNGVFDMPLFYHNGLTNANYYVDTMVLHYLLDERQGTHSLERLAVNRYRAPDYKTQFREDSLGVTKFMEDEEFGVAIGKVSQEELFDYNGADVDYTFRLTIDLLREVTLDGQLDVVKDIEMPAAREFVNFSMDGLLVDRDYLENLGREWSEEERDLELRMRDMIDDEEFNPGSWQQLANVMYDRLELLPFGGKASFAKKKIPMSVIAKDVSGVQDKEARTYWTSKKIEGLPPRSTNAYMLYWLRQQHEFPDLVLQWRTVRKKRSTYYDGYIKHLDIDGRIRPQYDLVATKTGRKATRDPAIHNIERGDLIYNIFIADPGWCLIHADYAQAELRMMAHYSGDKNLTYVLHTTDPHTHMAMRMFELTEADIKKMSKPELLDKRIAAKTITFGLPYGRTAKGLAPQLGFTVAETEKFIRAYFEPFPDLEQWLKDIRDQGIEDQEVESIFGRKRRWPLITDRYHTGSVRRMIGNHPIQSAINDLTLLAYTNSAKALREHNIPVRIRPHIHDSINFMVPKPRWKESVKVIMEAMDYIPFETEVRFPGSCEIGERWGGMLTVHDRGEWIVPDEDKNAPDWIMRELIWTETDPMAL